MVADPLSLWVGGSLLFTPRCGIIAAMYSVPTEFAERLHQEFDGRLRVRWSHAERAFVVEQKIARGLADQFPVLDDQDDLIRLRDGYIKVMSVNTGTKVPCPTKGCLSEFQLPTVFESWMLECARCKAKGYPYQHVFGFFELNDRLIEYLRSLDPLKGASRRNRDRVDRTNDRTIASHERLSDNLLEDAVSDHFLQIAGIPHTGYTGKVFPGTEL